MALAEAEEMQGTGQTKEEPPSQQQQQERCGPPQEQPAPDPPELDQPGVLV